MGPRFLGRTDDSMVNVCFCKDMLEMLISVVSIDIFGAGTVYVDLMPDYLMVLLQRLVRDFYKILNQVKSEEIPDGLKLPASFDELVSEMKTNQYDAKTFAIELKAMVCPFAICVCYILLIFLRMVTDHLY